MLRAINERVHTVLYSFRVAGCHLNEVQLDQCNGRAPQSLIQRYGSHSLLLVDSQVDSIGTFRSPVNSDLLCLGHGEKGDQTLLCNAHGPSARRLAFWTGRRPKPARASSVRRSQRRRLVNMLRPRVSEYPAPVCASIPHSS